MGETPKKIVESSFKCFICSSASLKNNKILIFGKSSLDIAGAIRSSVDVSCYSGPVYMQVGRSYKADHPSAICFLYSVYTQEVVLGPSARIFLAVS